MSGTKGRAMKSRKRCNEKAKSGDPFCEFMDWQDSFCRMDSARNMMDQMDRMFDHLPFSIAFEDMLLPLDITGDIGKVPSSSLKKALEPKKSDSKVTGHPTYIKAVSSLSLRDSKGNIVSEKKGYEKNNDGLDKRAYQRRVNDQYHLKAKRREKADEKWKTEQRLVNIKDDEKDIKKFDDRFTKTKKKMLKQYRKKPRAVRGGGKKKAKNKKPQTEGEVSVDDDFMAIGFDLGF